MPTDTPQIPKTQTVALVRSLGGPIEFVDDYPVPVPGKAEVLAKVLYSGVCQSDLHTKEGTAAGADGRPITAIKLPHIGGHEGVARIVALGTDVPSDVYVGQLVGVRFTSRICRRCEFCLAGREQHCPRQTNHLHHEDGAFQEYIALDTGYLTILPQDVDPAVIGPVLCAGLTTYKAVRNSGIKPLQWLVVIGAGGGLGHLAVQYATASGAKVIGIDGGDKRSLIVDRLGAAEFLDFKTLSPTEMTARVHELTDGGAHAAVVTAGSAAAFASAAEMLRIGGTLSCVGIPPDHDAYIRTSVASIVIKGLTIRGNLVGSLSECLEAVEFVRQGKVRPIVQVRPFRDLPEIYEEMKQGKIEGRVAVRIGGEA